MISPDTELCARLLGIFLLLLCVSYWREWHKGGALLVVQTWARETLYHLGRYIRSVQPPSEDWTRTRIRATRLATGRYWRGRMARRVRLRRYMFSWLAKPEFQSEMKRHVGKRIAAVVKRGY